MTDSTIQLTSNAMDAQLSNLQKDVAVIREKTAEIAGITSPEEEARAAEFCQQIKLRIDQADEARKFLVKPLNDHVKKINATFKETIEPLEEALGVVKNGMIAWRKSEEVRAAKEAAEKAKMEAAMAVQLGDMSKLQQKAVEIKEAQTVATTKVATPTGNTHFRKVWRFAVEDPLIVPAGYWVIDEKLIAVDVKAGKIIPGVKVWQEETPVFGS